MPQQPETLRDLAVDGRDDAALARHGVLRRVERERRRTERSGDAPTARRAVRLARVLDDRQVMRRREVL
jgi:hypothetical protein